MSRISPVLELRPEHLLFGIFFLGSTHYWQQNAGGIGLDLPNNCLSWCVVALIVVAGVHGAARKGEIVYSRFTIGLLITVVALAIPYCYLNSDYPYDSYGRMAGVVAGLLLFGVLQQSFASHRDWIFALALVVAACDIEAMLGAIQFYYLDMEVVGTFQQRNNIAVFCVTGLICSCVLLRELARTESGSPFRSLRSLALVCPLVVGFVLMAAHSLSGWLAFALSSALLVANRDMRRAFGTLRVYRTWALFLAISLLWGAYAWYGATAESSLGRELASDPRGVRGGIYHMCVAMFLDAPWIGYGYGDFIPAFLEYRGGNPAFHHVHVGPLLAHPHNELLLWAVEGGVLPLITLVWTGAWFMLRGARRKGNEVLPDWALLLPIVILNMSEFPFHQSVLQWVTFVVLVAHAERDAPLSKIAFRYGGGTTIVAGTLALVVIVYMAGTLQTLHHLTQFVRTGRTDLRQLTHVVLPAGASQRFYHTIMFARLSNGMKGGLADEVAAFLDWAEEEIPRRPSVRYYAAWIEALLFADRPSEARARLEDARRLFPLRQERFDRFDQYLRRTSAAQPHF